MSDSGLTLPTRSEAEARAERSRRRAESLHDIEAKMRADGQSERMIREVVDSVGSAFAFGDALDQLFGVNR